MSDRRPMIFLCGVSKDKCSGGESLVNASLGTKRKTHPTPQAAFTCYKNSLLAQGYKQIDSRAFQPPDGGPVRVLTKPSHFGAALRNGKEGTRNMSNVKIKGGGRRGGTITSC